MQTARAEQERGSEERGIQNTEAKRDEQNKTEYNFLLSVKRSAKGKTRQAQREYVCVWGAGAVKGELNRNAERGNEAGRETGTRALKLRFSS